MSTFFALAKAILVLSFVWILTGCGIYRSAGRDQFESRYAGRVTLSALADETCWIQPATEALLIAELNHQQYRVRALSAEEIEVCLD